MRTKEEFVSRWRDELSGLLMRSFAESRQSLGDFGRTGQEMIAQLNRAKSLLERMYEDLVPKAAPANGAAAAKPAGGVPQGGTPVPGAQPGGGRQHDARPEKTPTK